MKRRVCNPGTVFDSLQYGFSQAVVVQGGRRVFLSGQVGIDVDQRVVGKGLAAQMKAALDNIETILAELDGHLAQIAMLRIYIVESALDDQSAVADALIGRFPTDPPATSWIVVSGLSEPEWLVEVEAEAVLPEEID